MPDAITADDLPLTLQLWFCIGCGSMGNFGACTGDCRKEGMQVVSAEAVVDLLEARFELREMASELARVMVHLSGPFAAADDAKAIWRELQAEARQALATLKAQPGYSDMSVREPAASTEIWRCATCGEVEATRPCIGVCIRKMGEFVSKDSHDAVAAEVAKLQQDCDETAALLRRFVVVTAREGQWRSSLSYFSSAAERLRIAQTP